MNEVEEFWNEHTVWNAPAPTTVAESQAVLDERNRLYPDYRRLMEPGYGVVLDYGCGPGHDLIEFNDKHRCFLGADVSEKALDIARIRCEIHGVPAHLLKVTDDGTIPLVSESVDYIHCGGVVHHVSYPEDILAEFYRILDSHGSAKVMAYNRDSHFVQVEMRERFPHMDPEAAFSAVADGGGCPIARLYSPDEFVSMCEGVGFEAEHIGTYKCISESDEGLGAVYRLVKS